MKVKIAYLPEEAREAERIITAVSAILPNGKPCRREKHPPFKHVYFVTKSTVEARSISKERLATTSKRLNK